MNLEATFCLGYVKDLNVAILELPCLNKHISMLILLPKEIEDETTGLEKVREKNFPSCEFTISFCFSVPPSIFVALLFSLCPV